MRYPLTKIEDGFKCVEVGVWQGDFSEQILKHNPGVLHLIDPWIHQNAEWVQWAKGDAIKKAYETVLRKYSDTPNVKIHKKNSTDVVFEENSIDWVYIDADHSCDSVRDDLKHWFKFVKPGGYLCGDDYDWTSPLTAGPKLAVDQFAKKKNLQLEVMNGQYVLYK